MNPKVAVVVGSLRRQSWSRKLAEEIIRRARDKLSCSILEIGDLPLYNEDLESKPPASWERLRQGIDATDGVLFITPEYNRSIPGVLKNALDVGSRPGGRNHWAGKPAAVISQTPYQLGGFGANHALRQTFAFLDMPVLQQPEMYIALIGQRFAEDGRLIDAETGQKLDALISAFAGWIARTRTGGTSDADSFAQFLGRRAQAATAYVNGDSSSLNAIVTQTDPATFMSPGGDVVVGATSIANRYTSDADNFAAGSTSDLKILQSAAGQLGFWTGIQHATVKFKGKDGLVAMDLRVTEVFRFENGRWVLIHRHADISK